MVVLGNSKKGGSRSLPPSARLELLLGRVRRRLGRHRRGTPSVRSLNSSQREFSINLREMMAVQKGLLEFSSLLRGKTIALFCDNVTTVAYLRRLGGTRSQVLFLKAREILLWVESMKITLLPQFIQGSLNTRADLLSQPNLVIGSEWTLHQEVVQDLLHQWPAIIDLFATSLTARLPVFFAPAWEPKAAGVDAFLQPWDNLQAYAFPPIAIVKRVLYKLRASHDCDLTLIAPFWPQREWFPDLLELLSDIPIELPKRLDLLRQPHFHRFHENLPMLHLTAWRLSSDSPVRRKSTRLNYQACFGKFRKWCRDCHHRSSKPTIPKIAEFLTFLFKTEKAAVSTIKGYRAMLSSVFKFCPPSMVFDAGTLASVFDRLNNLLSKFEGSSTPQVDNVGSVRSSTAGPSDNARLNPLTQVADSAPQGPDAAPGPSKAMHVPPAPGPSHPVAEESGELPSARVGEDSWEPIRAGRLGDSPPEGLRSRLDSVHTKITQHRETIDFVLSREMTPPAHYYSDLMFSTPSMITCAVLLLSHVRLPHPAAVGILQMSLLQLRLPLLHAQILRHAQSLVIHLSLGLLLAGISDSLHKTDLIHETL